MDALDTTLIHTVKPNHLQSQPGTSRVYLYGPSKLPVLDKQTGLGPSTSLQQLTSASVEWREAASVPDKFYKPVLSVLPRITPLGPVSTLGFSFCSKKMLGTALVLLLRRQNIFSVVRNQRSAICWSSLILWGQSNGNKISQFLQSSLTRKWFIMGVCLIAMNSTWRLLIVLLVLSEGIKLQRCIINHFTWMVN